MSRTISSLVLVLCALRTTACSPGPGDHDAASDITMDQPDAGNDGTDVADDGRDAFDALDALDASDVADDVAADTGPGPDVITDPMCPTSVIDLATAGMHVGNAIDYVGTNAGTPVRSMVQRPWIVPPTHVVVMRYTPTVTGAVAVSLANAGTSPRFDAMVWALDHCSADQSRLLGWSPGFAPSFVVRNAMAGVAFDIAVGAYVRYVDDVDVAPFELRLVPLPTVALGMPCDPRLRTDACALDTVCIDDGTGPRCVARVQAGASCGIGDNRCPEDAVCFFNSSGGRCVVPGQDGGTCLQSASPCAAGLACFSDGNCHPASQAQSSCNYPGGRCLDIESCVSPGSCVPDGSANASCRRDGEPCDAGLACNGLQCRTARAVGDGCDFTGNTDACVTGSSCVGTPAVCVADGASEARCRSEAPRCDAGLSCESGRCRATAAIGAACSSNTSCATGSICVQSGGSGTCVADGADGAACRVDAPYCDAGLACGGYSTLRCRPLVMEGGACDASGATNSCAPGLVCLNSVCRPAGA